MDRIKPVGLNNSKNELIITDSPAKANKKIQVSSARPGAGSGSAKADIFLSGSLHILTEIKNTSSLR